MKPKYKVLSLFSGAGGLDVGLESSGRLEIVAAIEREPSFCETLRVNISAGRLGSSRTRVIQEDVTKVNARALMTSLGLVPGELDVLVGGPPCQSFSTAGRRGTTQDERGRLLWAFLDILDVFRPKVFLMENVRGLLSAAREHRPIKERPEHGGAALGPNEQPGSVVAHWLEDLDARTEHQYRVDCFEVNAVNYGAPQLRERVLFFGNAIGARFDFPGPTHGEGPGLQKFSTLRDALSRVTDPGDVLDFSPRKKAYLALIPPGGNWRTLPEELQRESMGKAWFAKGGRSGWWRRLTADLPSPTITTMPNHASTSLCHPTETRALGVAECAAVQEFPSDWEFAGTTLQKYTQVGNAIPVRLAKLAGELIAAVLDATKAGQSRPAPVEFRRVYVRSHVRTRQWYRRGSTYIWVTESEEDGGRYRVSTAQEQLWDERMPA